MNWVTYTSVHLHAVFVSTDKVVGFIICPEGEVSRSSIDPFEGQRDAKVIQTDPEMGQKTGGTS